MSAKRLFSLMVCLAIAVPLMLFIPSAAATASMESSAPTVSAPTVACPSPATDPVGNILCTARNEGQTLTRHYCQIAFSWNSNLLNICYRLAGG